jgi:4-hydroxy-3-methylbut-2-en-1-yl diphosphate synthase IspG/GcpE
MKFSIDDQATLNEKTTSVRATADQVKHVFNVANALSRIMSEDGKRRVEVVNIRFCHTVPVPYEQYRPSTADLRFTIKMIMAFTLLGQTRKVDINSSDYGYPLPSAEQPVSPEDTARSFLVEIQKELLRFRDFISNDLRNFEDVAVNLELPRTQTV